MESTDWLNATHVIESILAIIGFIALLCGVMPIYSVWSSKKAGEADLEQAHFEQQIQVAKANARLQAAETNKKAAVAVIEAEAVAKQIEVIGNNLQKHDLYLKWQWIKMMEDHSDSATIYIPTEAGLPILEAARFKAPQAKETEPEDDEN